MNIKNLKINGTALAIAGVMAVSGSIIGAIAGVSGIVAEEKRNSISNNIEAGNLIDDNFGTIEGNFSFEDVEKELFNESNFEFIEVSNDSVSEEKIEKALESEKKVGLIVKPTNYTYSSIYKTVDFVKELISKYDIKCPILYDVSKYMSNDTIDANCKLAEEFCNKLTTNGCYVGLYGSSSDINNFIGRFEQVVKSHSANLYDKMISLDCNLDGTIDPSIFEKGNMFKFANGAILWKYDLANIIENNGLNKKENFIGEYVYTVEPGDNLYYIADTFDISVDNLKDYNNIVMNTIHPGDQIVIPNNYVGKSGLEINVEEVISEENNDDFNQREATRDPGQFARVYAGIDVSSYQGDIDWSKVKSEIDYAIIKIGDFSNFHTGGDFILDSKFERNIEECKKHGIPVGVYYYSCANNKEEARTEALMITELLKGYELEYPVYIDAETQELNSMMYYEPDSFEKLTDEALDVIRNAGFYPGIYANKTYAGGILHMSDKCSIWLTSNETYNQRKSTEDLVDQNNSPILFYPSEEVDSYQFSEKGYISGIDEDVDIDYSSIDLKDKVLEKKNSDNINIR